MSVSAVGLSSSSLAAATRAAAASGPSQGASSYRTSGWHDPKDTNQDGVVSAAEDLAYRQNHPELQKAQVAGAAQQASVAQQAGNASIKAATGLDLVG